MSIAAAVPGTITVTRFTRLNELLSKEKLGIPEFRRKVSPSGHNLQWLRKTLGRGDTASAELRELLTLDMHHLLAAIAVPQPMAAIMSHVTGEQQRAPHNTIRTM